MKKLFLDIETIPSESPPSLDDINAPANYKDPVKIEAYKENALQDVWAKQALKSYEGQMICAAWALSDGAVQCISGKEEEVVEALYSAMLMSQHYVGHNVGWDLLFACHAGIRHGNQIHVLIKSEKKWERNFSDTMEMAGFGLEWNYKISLVNLCKLCGVKPPVGEGADVWDWHKAGEMDKIEKHCISDVEATRACYFKLHTPSKFTGVGAGNPIEGA